MKPEIERECVNDKIGLRKGKMQFKMSMCKVCFTVDL